MSYNMITDSFDITSSYSTASSSSITDNFNSLISPADHEKIKELIVCPICNKVFKRKLNLKRHEKTHNPIISFKCNVFDPKERTNKTCNASFTRKEDLVTHKRVHTGERPYKCNTCDATFTRNSDWRYHEKNHPKNKRKTRKQNEMTAEPVPVYSSNSQTRETTNTTSKILVRGGAAILRDMRSSSTSTKYSI